MSFLDTLTSKLGFNEEEEPVKKTAFYPTPTGAPIKKGIQTPTPFVSTLNKKLESPIKMEKPTPFVSAMNKALPKISEPNKQQLVKDAFGLPAELGRAVITRPIRTVIKSFEELGGYLGDSNYKPKPYIPTTPVEKALYGDEPIRSYPEQAREQIKISKDIQKPILDDKGEVLFKGVDKRIAIPLAFMGSIGVPLADLLPGGGEKKKVAEKLFKGVFDDILESAVKSTDDVSSFNLLKEAGVSDDIAKETAPLVTKATTKVEAEKVIRDTAAKQLQIVEAETATRIKQITDKKNGIKIDPETGIKVKGAPVILTADEVDELKFLTKNKSRPENIIAAEKFRDMQDEIASKVSKDLADEARKYKTADEFVKGQGQTFYRGEGGTNVAQGKALLAEGKHFASDAEYPKGFGKVGEYVIKPEAKILDLGDSTFQEISKKLGIPEKNYISPKELSTIAKEKGYDVLKYNGEYKSTGKPFTHTVDLTGDSFQTKSQLEAIWDGANKNIKQVEETKALETARGVEKERKYITSAKASDKVQDMVKAELNGVYDPKSNKEIVARANERVADNIEEAKRMATTESSDEAVATGVSLTEHYSDEITKAATKEEKLKIAKEAAEVINKQAEILTEAGRTVQAASLLGKQTPEGLLRTTARKIKEYNKLHPNKKVPELNGDNVVDILEKGKKIEEMGEGLAKEVAKKDLVDTLQSLIPTPMWKKIVHIYKAGLLTGIGTHGVNVLSTFFNGVLESAKNIPATGIDLATSIVTGNRTKAIVSPLRYMEGGAEGVKKGWNFLKTGVQSESAETALEHYKVTFDSKLGKFLGKYADGVYRVLGTEDTPFFYGALKKSLVEQALVGAKNSKKVFANAKEKTKYVEDFINNPSDEVLELAQLDAKVATFKNDTQLGKMAQAIQNVPVLGPIAQMTVLPFAKTPSAVAMQMLNYTPGGLLTTFYKSFMQGKFNQKEFAEGLGRVVTGTGALWLGSELYKQGKISLGYPKDSKEKAKWEATGKRPNSVLIDGKWIPLITFGPAGSVLTIGGHVTRGQEETGSVAGGVISGLAGGVQNLTEQTFLTGVKNAMDAINEPEKEGVAWVGNTIASIVPSLINNVNQAFDDYQRKSSGTILGPLKSRIPGVRQTLPKKLDVWGQPMERNRTALGTALSPIRLSNKIEGPLNTEVERLEMLGEDIRPTKVDGKIKNIDLNEKEYYKYQRLYGTILSKGLNTLLKNEQYQSLDPDDQAIVWKKTVKEIRSASADIILPELMKRRYDLPPEVDAKVFTVVLNELYKKSPDFAKASPEKQKKIILEKLLPN